MKTTAAKTAKAIRTELKQKFPGQKFSVRSDNFAGGDSVDVHYTDGPLKSEVDKVIAKFQYGSFNGMIDMYEYTNSREDIPQAKYVMAHRKISDETRAMIIEKIRTTYTGGENFNPDQYFEPCNEPGHTLIFREFAKMDLYKRPEQSAKVKPVTDGDIIIEQYSPKAGVVRGDTKPIKETLKELGCRFNPRLQGGAGWIFPIKKQAEIAQALNL